MLSPSFGHCPNSNWTTTPPHTLLGASPTVLSIKLVMFLVFPSQLSIGIAPQPELNIDGFGYKTSAILAPSELPLGITSSSNLLLNLFRTPSQPRPIEMALISILFLVAFVPSLQGVSLSDKVDELGTFLLLVHQKTTPFNFCTSKHHCNINLFSEKTIGKLSQTFGFLISANTYQLEKLSQRGAFCGYK